MKYIYEMRYECLIITLNGEFQARSHMKIADQTVSEKADAT